MVGILRRLALLTAFVAFAPANGLKCFVCSRNSNTLKCPESGDRAEDSIDDRSKYYGATGTQEQVECMILWGSGTSGPEEIIFQVTVQLSTINILNCHYMRALCGYSASFDFKTNCADNSHVKLLWQGLVMDVYLTIYLNM